MEKSKASKIKDIIAKHYGTIAISVLGTQSYSEAELKTLKQLGSSTKNQYSLFDLIYKQSFLNPDGKGPKTIQNAIKQQVLEDPKINQQVLNSLNESIKLFIEKMKVDAQARIENIIRDTSDIANLYNLKDTKKPVQDIVQSLKATMPTATKDWDRVALTEISNAIGLGSVDRILSENKGKDLSEIYGYKLVVGDGVTCQWCRKFYGFNKPKIYKLSTLLANGSNYGRNKKDWKPVIGATHPNTRTSAFIELKPGFILGSNGPTFVGEKEALVWLKENAE